MALLVVPLLALLASLLILSDINGVYGGRSIFMEEDLEFERQLKQLNKPSIKSIKMSSSIPKATFKEASSSGVKHVDLRLQGGGCPSGTVPIRKTTKEDLIRWKSFSNSSGNIHQFLDEGPGKHVHPKLYGDNKTHTFGHWTADGSQKTGCFNALCNGFVQVSKSSPLGLAFPFTSTTGGAILQLPLFLFQNIHSNNWWLGYGEGDHFVDIGYWPPELFNGIKDSAPIVGWRGEAYAPQGELYPQMGTGNLPSRFKGSRQSKITAYFRAVRVYNESYIGVGPYDRSLQSVTDSPYCFYVFDYPYIDDYWRHVFFYGGPGGKC
ncbi:hypothetical protein NE237_032082 [Protea cynaroides]|uniref:Neprosin PEP catalytic domain-containing protein n=1 Tax=Protea cynaroides TaxID=273540 RepID=A0A9Q0L2Q9_9MAGN|nr:hypothetical protein NE237_032082 [Protea cynaroides]